MSESKCLRKWDEHLAISHLHHPALQFVLNLPGCSFPVSSLTVVRRRFPSNQEADRRAVLRLWPVNLPAALYLRWMFHSGARWWKGLHSHKDMYNHRKPILKHWSFPTPSPRHTILQPLWPLRQRPWLSLCGPVFGLASVHPLIWWTDAFFKTRRYKMWFNPLCLNRRPSGH